MGWDEGSGGTKKREKALSQVEKLGRSRSLGVSHFQYGPVDDGAYRMPGSRPFLRNDHLLIAGHGTNGH